MRKIGRTKFDNFPLIYLFQHASFINPVPYQLSPVLRLSTSLIFTQVPCFFSTSIIIFINLTSASSSPSCLLLFSPSVKGHHQHYYFPFGSGTLAHPPPFPFFLHVAAVPSSSDCQYCHCSFVEESDSVKVISVSVLLQCRS